MTLLLASTRSPLSADRLLWRSIAAAMGEYLGVGSAKGIGHETEFSVRFKNYRNNCVKGSENPTQINSLIILEGGRYWTKLVPG